VGEVLRSWFQEKDFVTCFVGWMLQERTQENKPSSSLQVVSLGRNHVLSPFLTRCGMGMSIGERHQRERRRCQRREGDLVRLSSPLVTSTCQQTRKKSQGTALSCNQLRKTSRCGRSCSIFRGSPLIPGGLSLPVRIDFPTFSPS
jgi:hypothetical protein